MINLIERLRSINVDFSDRHELYTVIKEAAAEIEALQMKPLQRYKSDDMNPIDTLINALSEEEHANHDDKHAALYAAAKFILDYLKTTIPPDQAKVGG